MRNTITKFCAMLLALSVAATCSAAESGAKGESGIAAFGDIDASSPYYEDICYVAEKGIIDGTDSGNFAPSDICVRKTVATALYRMASSPDTDGSNPFKDTENDNKAVIWGAENGLIKGVEPDRFAPDSSVTREQLVTFLFRYACFKGIAQNGEDSEILAAYADSSDISVWAVSSFSWALDSGIIDFADGGKLNPKEEVSRMQAAAVISRYMRSARLSYSDFKALSPSEQRKVFSEMSGDDIYSIVLESDENWPVTSYDLISPENAKYTIVLFGDDENLHFNLSWPHFGGFVPETIDSIGNLSGTLDVSRDGGDGGCSVSYGKNEDGSYPNDSQRSVPKTSATVRTGTLDIDRYKTVVDAITEAGDESDAIKALVSLGYTEEIAARFVSDYGKWFSRDEVSGADNISDGAKLAGNTVEEKYGYCGLTAPWTAGDLTLEGGSGQLNTVFTWGTLCASGLIYDTGTAEID